MFHFTSLWQYVSHKVNHIATISNNLASYFHFFNIGGQSKEIYTHQNGNRPVNIVIISQTSTVKGIRIS